MKRRPKKTPVDLAEKALDEALERLAKATVHNEKAATAARKRSGRFKLVSVWPPPSKEGEEDQ